jgi:hypothetical protein
MYCVLLVVYRHLPYPLDSAFSTCPAIRCYIVRTVDAPTFKSHVLGNLQNLDIFAVLVVARRSRVCRRRFRTACLISRDQDVPEIVGGCQRRFETAYKFVFKSRGVPKIKGVVGWFVTDVSGRRMGPISSFKM